MKKQGFNGKTRQDEPKKNKDANHVLYIMCGHCQALIMETKTGEHLLVEIDKKMGISILTITNIGPLTVNGASLLCSKCDKVIGSKNIKNQNVLIQESILILQQDKMSLCSEWIKTQDAEPFKVCPFFIRTSTCMFSDKCKLYHPKDIVMKDYKPKEEIPTVPLPKSKFEQKVEIKPEITGFVPISDRRGRGGSNTLLPKSSTRNTEQKIEFKPEIIGSVQNFDRRGRGGRSYFRGSGIHRGFKDYKDESKEIKISSQDRMKFFEDIAKNPSLLELSQVLKAVISSNLTKRETDILLTALTHKDFLNGEDWITNEILTEIANSLFPKCLSAFLAGLRPNTGYDEIRSVLVLYEEIFRRCPTLTHNISIDYISALVSKEDLKKLYDRVCLVKFNSMKQDQHKKMNSSRLNAIEDISQISIYPDLLNLQGVDKMLEKNHLHEWETVREYIGVHFRLQLEEFLFPLREGLKKYEKKEKMKFSELVNFDGVRLKRVVPHREGIAFAISFKSTKKIIDLDKSKVLMEGSLLIFFEKDKVMQHEPLCATITSRKGLKGGSFEIEILPQNGCKFKDVEYIMFESPCYWKSVESVLKSLKDFDPEKNLPFQEILCFKKHDLSPPNYILSNPSVDVSTILGTYEDRYKNPITKIDVTKSWIPKDNTYLDVSQNDAARHILNSKVSLVKGPPGTGKTFIGIKAVELISKHLKDSKKQIVMVCYTNHALDQFLEGILPFEKNFVRIGSKSRSENPDILTRNILELRKHSVSSKIFSKTKWEFHKINEKLSNLHNRLLMMKDTRSLFQFFEMHDFLKNIQKITKNKETYHIPDVKEAIRIWEDCQEDKKISQIGKERAKKLKELKKKKKNEFGVLDGLDEDDKVLEDEVLHEIKEEKIEDLIENPEIQDKEDVLSLQVLQDEIDQIQREILLQDDYDVDRLDEDLDENNVPEPYNLDSLVEIAVLLNLQNPWSMNKKRRNQVLNQLRQEAFKAIHHKIAQIEIELNEKLMTLKELSTKTDVNILHKTRIIALTSTGAATNKALLDELKAPILLIEEAGELLESQTIACLGKHVQHLIMIGDEQQLQPKVNTYHLVKKFNFAISMFERLILQKLPFQTIMTQQRMRPEISKITRLFYPDLVDHPKVKDFPNVSGVGCNVLFFTHQYKEEIVGQSKSNKFEAEMVVGLAEYLAHQQDYTHEDITIVTPYEGQKFLIKKNLLQKNLKIRTVTIDDYQGEENKIILLSLVRSNKDAIAGFVEIENRVIVSLSRAKYGLYIVGNSVMLQDKDSWYPVIKSMGNDGLIRTSVPLYCPNHPEDAKTVIESPKDFLQVSHGGCSKTCLFQYKCGHVCGRKCHPKDPNHVELKCLKACESKRECGHSCGSICHFPKECPSFCKVVVKFDFPDCAHMTKVECSSDRSIVKCNKKCGVKLNCGHLCKETCQKCKTSGHVCTTNITSNCKLCKKPVKHHCGTEAICDGLCNTPLPCGHSCAGKCGKCVNGVHKDCNYNCQRSHFCGHNCIKHFCSVPCPDCTNPCQVKCFHGWSCKNNCLEYCIECKEPCPLKCTNKKCLGKSCTQNCFEICDRAPCNEQCDKILPCKHQCQGLCGEKCPECILCYRKDWKDSIMQYTVQDLDLKNDFLYELSCGHVFMVDGLDQMMKTESEAIGFKKCPNCMKLIVCEGRYQFEIKKTRMEIENVKKRIEKKKIEEKLGREMAMKVMRGNHNAGYWYKCPKGHPYWIGECGGAMEESKCIDCGEKIGGTRHILLGTNSQAAELDKFHQ